MRFAWRRAAIAAGVALGLVSAPAGLVRAGGGSFGPDDADDDSGPPFFGFAKDRDGAIVPDAKITVSVEKLNSNLILRTDSQGHFFVKGFDKSVDPGDVEIACGKEGYREVSVTKRPTPGNPTAPVEIACTLEHE